MLLQEYNKPASLTKLLKVTIPTLKHPVDGVVFACSTSLYTFGAADSVLPAPLSSALIIAKLGDSQFSTLVEYVDSSSSTESTK